MLPASTRAEPSAAELLRTPSETFIRRSSAGLRPSTRRPSGLTHSGPDLSPRISERERFESREKERERKRKKEKDKERES